MLAPVVIQNPQGNLPSKEEVDQTNRLIDSMRVEGDGSMGTIRRRSQDYLRWYSPVYDWRLHGHDPDPDQVLTQDDVGKARPAFTLARAVVDIYAALEATAGVTVRAEPERLGPLIPSLDQDTAMRNREMYRWHRTIEGIKADMRSSQIRSYMKRDDFDAKHFFAVRKKNLHGFSWMKVLPDGKRKNPASYVVQDPTTVFPMWSTRRPGDIEALLSAQQMSARLASAKWPFLNLVFKEDGRTVDLGASTDSGRYENVNDKFAYDSTRTMVWVEEMWWIDREYSGGNADQTTCVYCAIRVAGKVVGYYRYPGWSYIPWVYWENSDERDAYGWSDIANVMDINDELNRRIGQQGDTIGMYSSPRFMLLGSTYGRDVDMPGPFEKVDLQDTESIQQIMTRIDTYPVDQHVQTLIDLMHRTTGLPPIVWGLIANAQTSGRALSASWKATEARLSPKLMSNRLSVSRYIEVTLDFARNLGWHDATKIWTANDGSPFEDFLFEFPPMEPRDFMDVTQNAITLRDAGLLTTIEAIRQTGVADAEDMLEEVLAEMQNIFLHPDKVNAFLLAQRAQLDNQAYAAQVAQQSQAPAGPQNTATVAQQVGQATAASQAVQQAGQPQAATPGTVPPTQQGAPGNAAQTLAPGATPGPPGQTTKTGTLLRNGQVSGQILQQNNIG